MAYYVDKSGNYELDVFFKNLETKDLISDTLRSVTSLVWANDNKTLFYSIQDSITNRSFKVYKHVLGQSYSQDKLLYHETDSLYRVGLIKSKSEEFIFLNSSNITLTFLGIRILSPTFGLDWCE